MSSYINYSHKLIKKTDNSIKKYTEDLNKFTNEEIQVVKHEEDAQLH